MKSCTKCGIEQSLDQFGKNAKAVGGVDTQCQTCRKAYASIWRNQNRERQRGYQMKWLDDRRAILREYKDVPCTDCGLNYPYYIMDFDHVGEKSFDIGAAIKSWTVSTDDIIKEIAKCEVVCSNCHRERTHQRRIESVS